MRSTRRLGGKETVRWTSVDDEAATDRRLKMPELRLLSLLGRIAEGEEPSLGIYTDDDLRLLVRQGLMSERRFRAALKRLLEFGYIEIAVRTVTDERTFYRKVDAEGSVRDFLERTRRG